MQLSKGLAMSLEMAKTEFVEAEGVRFAFRRIGRTTGVPLHGKSDGRLGYTSNHGGISLG
jgi:hypothetical protein